MRMPGVAVYSKTRPVSIFIKKNQFNLIYISGYRQFQITPSRNFFCIDYMRNICCIEININMPIVVLVIPLRKNK